MLGVHLLTRIVWAKSLDLLCAPALVCLSHVRWWLNRREEFENNICDANSTHDGAWNVVVPRSAKETSGNEQINWHDHLVCLLFDRRSGNNLTETPPDKAEHKRRESHDIRGNLKLKTRSCY